MQFFNPVRRYGPSGVPADLQSADKKGSTTLMRICNPPQARMQRGDMKAYGCGLQIRDK